MKPASEGITRCIRASRGSARTVNVPGAAVMPAASVRISTVFTGSSRHPGLMASPLLATSPTVVRRALASPTSPVRVDLRHAASAETVIVHPGTPLQPTPGHGADHTGVCAAHYQARDDGLETEPRRRLASDARRVTSVCSGAFVLAAAGLLDGRRAATHWAECTLLANGYPAVDVDRDSIYVRDGNTWTSAGVTAGIDLALALVAEDYGRKAAAAVARQLVVYLRRSGGQAQFSALLAAQDADSEPVQDLLTWLPDHLIEDLSVLKLARQANLS